MKKSRIFLFVFLVLGILFSFFILMPVSFSEEDISSYISSVSQKIAAAVKQGRFPRTILPHGRISAVLEISILPSGKVYMVEIIESSGIEDLDQEAKRFVRDLSPYPSFSQTKKLRRVRLPLEIVGEEDNKKKQLTEEVNLKPENPVFEKKGEEVVCPAAKEKDSYPRALQKKDRPLLRKISDSAVNTAALTVESKEKLLEAKKKIEGIAREAEGLYKTALDNSDPARVAQEQMDLAGLKIKDSGRNLFPRLEMEYSFSEGETITDPYESKAYALKLKQNLYDNGNAGKSFKKEKLNLEVAQNEYEKTVQELKFEVLRSYLNILGKEEELKELDSFKEQVGRDYQLAEDVYKAGGISKVEFVEIEAEYQRTLNMISQSDNEFQLAKEKLRASMNLPPNAEVPLLEDNLPKLGEVDIDVEECVCLGLENKPEVRLWEISLKAAEYAKDIAGSESAPRLDLETSYGASGEAYSQSALDLADEWKVMGVVTWLFGGNSCEFSRSQDTMSAKDVTEVSRKTSATTYSAKLGVMDKLQYYVQKKEAGIAYTQNESNLSKNKQEVIFEIRKSFLEYKQSFDEYQVALFEDKFSRVNLDLKVESFKIGKANLSEVVKARADYMRKRLALIRAKTSYFISLSSLDKTTAYSLGLFSSLDLPPAEK